MNITAVIIIMFIMLLNYMNNLLFSCYEVYIKSTAITFHINTPL